MTILVSLQRKLKRNSELIVVNKDVIPESYLRKFDYLVFPDNVAIVLGIAQAVGVDEETALQGMLNAPADPGAVRIKYFHANRTKMYLLMHSLLMNRSLQKRF